MAVLSSAARSAMCDAFVDLIDVGSTNSAGQIIIQTVAGAADLATIALNNPACGAASSGVATLDVDPEIKDASATGGSVAAQWVLQNRNEVTILTGNVGLVGSGKDMELESLTIPAGTEIVIESGSFTMDSGI